VEWRGSFHFPREVIPAEARAADLVIIGSHPVRDDVYRAFDPGTVILQFLLVLGHMKRTKDYFARGCFPKIEWTPAYVGTAIAAWVDFGVFHPGIAPSAPGLGPARADHWVSIEPVAIAVSRLRRSPAIAAPLDRWTQCIKTVTTRLRRIAASNLSRAGE
jgi:hypothetical protein